MHLRSSSLPHIFNIQCWSLWLITVPDSLFEKKMFNWTKHIIEVVFMLVHISTFFFPQVSPCFHLFIHPPPPQKKKKKKKKENQSINQSINKNIFARSFFATLQRQHFPPAQTNLFSLVLALCSRQRIASSIPGRVGWPVLQYYTLFVEVTYYRGRTSLNFPVDASLDWPLL